MLTALMDTLDLRWLAIAAAVFVATALATGVMYHYAHAQGMLDRPKARSSHFLVTPRGGGLSIVIVFLSAMLALFFFRQTAVTPPVFYTFSLAASAIAVLGYVDDRVGLSPWSRLTVQAVVVSLSILFLGAPAVPLFGWSLDSAWLLSPLAIVALLWWINLFNFMDGIDGIAGVEALCIALSAAAILFLTEPTYMLMPWIGLLACSVAGFLWWNWPPARIFMGDAASCFVGLMLGLFALRAAAETALNIWCWLILFSAFLLDATVTLLIRIFRGEKIHQAHRQHAYQLLAVYLSQLNPMVFSSFWSRAYAHRGVDLALIAFNALYLFPLALLAASLPEWGLAFALAAMAPMLWFSWRIRRPQEAFRGLL